MPEAIANGAATNSHAHGWQPVGAHQVKVKLEAGASISMIFGLGYIENPENKWYAPSVINPCLPRTSKGFQLSRTYRGAVYKITVDNSAGVESGIASFTVNGKAQEALCIPPFPAGTEVEVNIIMG